LREEGELALWKLAIKPGKPLTFGHFRGVPVIGLPGNPASTLVTFALLARPYLLRRQGVTDVAPLRFEVPVGFTWPAGQPPRIPARAPRTGQGDHLPQPELRAAQRGVGGGFVEVLEGTTLEVGDRVNFIPLSEVLN
jgi:molybdopterin molybdotransferase